MRPVSRTPDDRVYSGTPPAAFYSELVIPKDATNDVQQEYDSEPSRAQPY